MLNRIRCEYCNKPIKLHNIEENYEYKCPQCENIVYRPGASRFVVFSLAFTSTLLLFWTLFAPLLNVKILNDIQLSMYDTLVIFFQNDSLSGVFILLTIVLIPILLNVITIMILFYNRLQLSSSSLKKLVRTYLFIKEWNMIEVCFLGLLIALIKLYEISEVNLLIGFWINLLYVVVLYINMLVFNPLDFANIKKRQAIKNNMKKTVALFLLLAVIFIPPSNILPMMPTYKYSVTYDNTIMDGITTFWNQGEVIIPIIIFLASICIPILKIVGLIIMLIMGKFQVLLRFRKFATKYYIITDKIGKYSLLDIYVVVFASAYIQYDDLVRIGVGEAIIPFGMVVIFTMIASKNFDTRILWRKNV